MAELRSACVSTLGKAPNRCRFNATKSFLWIFDRVQCRIALIFLTKQIDEVTRLLELRNTDNSLPLIMRKPSIRNDVIALSGFSITRVLGAAQNH